MTIYGQVVVGPPGSGKTTYCNGMQQYLRLIGRETVVVNLDPANEYHHREGDEDHHQQQQQQQQQQEKQQTSGVASDPNSCTDSNSNSTTNTNVGREDKEPYSHLPYDAILDTSEDVINLSTVMEELNLGPNGGLIYCLEYIHHHMDAFQSMLQSKLESYYHQTSSSSSPSSQPPYILFDLPGQVELYTHSTIVQSILSTLIKNMDMRLVMVQLIDAHHCMDVHKFISSALLSTTTMLRLELPAVNVLSKIDLLSTYAGTSATFGNGNGNHNDDGSGGNYDNGSEYDIGMPFNLDFFMECQELDRLLPFLYNHENGEDDTYDNYGHTYNSTSEDERRQRRQEILDQDEEYQKAKLKTRSNKFYKRHYKLHSELCEVVNDFSLLSYVPLNINDAESVGRVLARIDKSNGCIFTRHGQQRQQQRQRQGNRNGKSGRWNEDVTVEDMFQCAMQVDREWGY